MSPPPDDDPPSDPSPADGPTGDEPNHVVDDQSDRTDPPDDGPGETETADQGAPEPGDSTAPRATDESTARQGPTGPSGASGNRTESTGTRTESRRSDAPAPRRARDGTDDDDHWLWTFVVDVSSSALAVLLVGFFLFTVSGVWPPMVAVESASMTPNMQTGDLVFVMNEDRFPADSARAETGVVTARVGADRGYETFGNPGDVIVFEPDGNGDETPIIHRAMFWVEDGERWYDEADKSAVGSASSCEELTNCPAPHAGFITKGDANPTYDQAGHSPHSGPVEPDWVVGTAEVRVPKLGCIRLPAERCGGVLETSNPSDELLNPLAIASDFVNVSTVAAPEPTVSAVLD